MRSGSHEAAVTLVAQGGAVSVPLALRRREDIIAGPMSARGPTGGGWRSDECGEKGTGSHFKPWTLRSAIQG